MPKFQNKLADELQSHKKILNTRTYQIWGKKSTSDPIYGLVVQYTQNIKIALCMGQSVAYGTLYLFKNALALSPHLFFWNFNWDGPML